MHELEKTNDMKRFLMGLSLNFLLAFYAEEPLEGQWLSGDFPIKKWWTYNGTGESKERPSMAFHFFNNGEAEFFMTIRTVKQRCIAEELVYKKGNIVIDRKNSAFIFYPAEGNYRTFYSCNPGLNMNRSTIREEMAPLKFYYSLKKGKKGEPVLGIRFDSDPVSAVSYFKKTRW